MKNLAWLVLLWAVIAVGPVSVFAATLQSDHTVLLFRSVNDDAYLAGGKVVVNADIGGDAVVAGGKLLVNGAVEEDLTIAGGSLVINGAVGDDVRAAGGDIIISRDVADDLVVAGGQITIAPGVTVGGDLLVAGGQVVMEGVVAGDVRVAGGEVALGGRVLGDARLWVHERLDLNGEIGGRTLFAAEEVSLGPDAAFGGEVEYWRRAGELDFGKALTGNAVYNPELEMPVHWSGTDGPGRRAALGLFAAWLVFSILSAALLIALLSALAPKYFGEAALTLAEGFWKKAGIGFLYFAVTPAVVLVLMATVIGLPLALFLLALYLFMLYFAAVLTAVVLARYLELRRGGRWGEIRVFFVSLGLFLGLKLLFIVPLLGWVTVAILVCAAFGALLATSRRILRQHA